MKKLIVVLSTLLALFLVFLTVRSLVLDGRQDPLAAAAEALRAVPVPEPEPESPPEPAWSPPARGNPLLLLDSEQIESELDRILEKHGAVGAQVAFIHDGEVAGSYAYGWATMYSDPMTTDHKIRIASVSKVIVGMAAMLLQEDGVVDVDEDIGKYWDTTARNPLYPDIPITIRTILNHTSTIANYSNDFPSAATIRSRLSYAYLSAEPGSLESWCYNNYAFQVLGSTLEIASDRILDDILNEKLFDPLEIDASFANGDLENTDLLATLYRGNTVEMSVGTQKSLHLYQIPGESCIFYAGGLTISAEDLAKLVCLLANDGVFQNRRLLQSRSVELMETYSDQPLADGTYQALPLLYVPKIYGRDGIYFHPGAAYGVYSLISYDPETGDGVVILTTGADSAADRYGIYNVCDEINEYVYDILR